MGNIRSFKDLIVWQKAMDLAMEIFTITKTFPAEEKYSLTDQIRRSSRSVPANISEAWRKRRYPAAFINKLSDADGNLVVEEKPTVDAGVLAWNAEDSEFMEGLRKTIRKANRGKAPQVFDPFAGGGAIPLEAMWLGCHASASDINPVAWLLLKGTLEYPQKYADKKWPLPDFIRTHASDTDKREHQNIVLVVTPSAAGLIQAEQTIASWMAWSDIKGSDRFKELEDEQKDTVKRRERESQKEALTFVKNAFELVIYIDKTRNAVQKKFTMGTEALFPTLVREKDLRIYREKINAETLLPGGPFSKWPAGDPSIKVKDMYGSFGRYPDMPKLVNRQVVINSIEDAVRRGLVALRYAPPAGGEEWFWHCPIEGVVDWADFAEAWLPAKTTLNKVHPAAVLPFAMAGLWLSDDKPVKLSTVCSWFDGTNVFDEIAQPGYPPEKRPIPKGDYKLVHAAVAEAVARGEIWLVFGNDSLLGEKPSELQLDPDANLFRPPTPLRAMDLLPGALCGSLGREAS